MEQHYLNALASALVVVDSALCVRFMNQAAEMLFEVSREVAIGRPFYSLAVFDDEVMALCARAFVGREAISLFEREITVQRNRHSVNIHITLVVADETPEAVITLERTDGLKRLAANERKQEISRAVGVMAAMLAHEVKNPLSGIRGAAQLLKEEVASEHQELAELICMETDRIRDLLAEVEIFTAGKPENRQPVNIHEVLQYVISIAKTGFARHVTFRERYDPSLPPVLGHRDLLVQMFLNLVKNAAEALADHSDAAITITTTYRSGYRVRQGEDMASLPVAVTIEDNGGGIPEALHGHLFEPFVSSKKEGRGLGLAIVAKIASDLGAVVELDREFEGGSRFVVWLGH